MAISDNLGLPKLVAPGWPLELVIFLYYEHTKILFVRPQVDGCGG